MSSSVTSTGRPPPLPPRNKRISNMSVASPTAIPQEPAPIVYETRPIVESKDTKETKTTADGENEFNVPVQPEQTPSTVEQSGWLSSILLFNREEPAELAELRKRVEEEEIKRYMTNFQKVSLTTSSPACIRRSTMVLKLYHPSSTSTTSDSRLNNPHPLKPARELIPNQSTTDAKSPSLPSTPQRLMISTLQLGSTRI